jgi:hypothetical protein
MSDLPSEFLVQFYSKLATGLSVPGVVGKNPGALLSLQIPGVYVAPHLDISLPQTQYYVANALNPALVCDWLLTRKTGTISDVYKSILDGKEMPLPSLKPEQKAELDKAQVYLFDAFGNPTAAYKNYLSLQLSCFEAFDNYEIACETEKNGGTPVPQEIKDQLTKASEAWEKEGNKNDVEGKIATIAHYEALEPAIFWHKLAERYAHYTRQYDTNTFQEVTADPPYERWLEEFGWSGFTFDNKDFNNQRLAGSAGMGGLKCCCCCCQEMEHNCNSGKDAFNGKSLLEGLGKESLSFATFCATCKLKRVEIIRPWMNANVFYSRAWRWSNASVSYGVTISTGGDIAGRVAPTGVLPILPVTMLLSKELDIYWQDAKTRNFLVERLREKQNLHLGPFRLSRAKFSDDGHISIPDPQIIGFISDILPQCPNPDSTLPWPLRTSNHSDDQWGVA